MSEIVDDCGDSMDLDDILYDMEIGKCVRFERDGDTLREISVFTGDEVYDVSVDEFKTECMVDEYHVVPDEVLEDPEQIIEEVMHAVMRGQRDACAGYSTWEIDIAWRLCSVEKVALK